jgi:nitroreductase
VEILEAIAARRSLGKMRPDMPPREAIERVLASGVHAANHHDTQPWRFFVLTNKARSEFGEVLAQALSRRLGETPSGSEAGGHLQTAPEGTPRTVNLDALLEGERRKPMRSPVLIVVGVHSEAGDAMTRREDLQAASAALQNMLLAATAAGLAAIWRTGDGAYDDNVKAWFGLQPQDEIAGILYLGYADESFGPAPARQRDFASKTEWRGWD